MCKELGRLARGYQDTEKINTMCFLTKEEINNMPSDCVVIYARIVVNYRQQKRSLKQDQTKSEWKLNRLSKRTDNKHPRFHYQKKSLSTV